MACAYEVSDIVVSRAGMGVLTELASLGKPAILIPLAGHQEENAKYFFRQIGGCCLKERGLTPEKLANEIEKLLKDKKAQEKLSKILKKFSLYLLKNRGKNRGYDIGDCEEKSDRPRHRVSRR